MLVLTRKPGEMVRIGQEISVQVLGIRGGQVSLGFTAPREVRIYREEVLRAVEEQNQRAPLADRDVLTDAEAAWKEFADGKHG
jgi:carbon storage regulator